MQAWQPQQIPEDSITHWQIGPLKIWIKRLGNEWQIAYQREVEAEEVLIPASTDVPVPENLGWTRWVTAGGDDTLKFVPVMPDRPVIVRPESPMRFPTGTDAVFYASVPIWIRVTVGKEHPVTLCEIPSVVLSNTWLGDQMQGELCYSMRTSARRSIASIPIRPHRASSTVLIHNDAEAELEFTRLSIRVQHLNIYWMDNRLWSNKVHVVFQDGENGAKLDYESKAPGSDGAVPVSQMSTAREPIKKSIFRKTFLDLKEFTTY
ncbi:MAG: DUF432 domain-containing protein [Planctomycetota bacterium]|nr:DUF432 domain-containing protein [Planctomycetota bacterium]MDA1142464.1 DUF432 domain-containing protein [Planctomycetota bacterium]